MSAATVDLASPAECAARAERMLAAQFSARQRAKDLREARALIRKHGLQTHKEVLDTLCCVAGCLNFNFKEIADQLVEMADELEYPTDDDSRPDDEWKRRQDRALGDAS